jgi:hypothetical protein
MIWQTLLIKYVVPLSVDVIRKVLLEMMDDEDNDIDLEFARRFERNEAKLKSRLRAYKP